MVLYRQLKKSNKQNTGNDRKPIIGRKGKNMKLEKKEFEKKVREIRNMMPAYNNDRRVVVLSEYSKKGKKILELASRCEGYTLNQIYDRWSEEKQYAFDEASEMCINSRHGNAFSICSHNSFGFSVSWLHDDGCTYLTKNTEYLVIFNE